MSQLSPSHRRSSNSSTSCKFTASVHSSFHLPHAHHQVPPSNPLQVLTQLGFPKHRIEKALAATGNRNAQVAAEWLIHHVNDPTLDENTPREYILYLCPTGPLLEQIERYYQETLKISFNTAHNCMPHIALCSFFQAPDEAVDLLLSGLEHAVDKMKNDLPTQLTLEFYKTNQLIGLFLSEDQNDCFKRLSNVFMRECSEFISGGELGPMHVISTCFPWCSSYPLLNPKRIEVEPYLKSLHMTLAYQFNPSDRAKLEQLAESLVDPCSPCTWELRLFSREMRIKDKNVYRVVESSTASEVDELPLVVGDFVYVDPASVGVSSDGWVQATSWLTGCTGQIPLSCVERTAESAAWTLHKCILLRNDSSALGGSPATLHYNPKQLLQPADSLARLSLDSSDSSKTAESLNMQHGLTSHKTATPIGRNLLVMRHAERIDFTFGYTWVQSCFDEKTKEYKRRDLNQPATLPVRSDPAEYILDTPLTMIGLYQATLTGKAIESAQVPLVAIYSSPSLRCIQTCMNIMKELTNAPATINIEPGLFEWIFWYPFPKRPSFMTPSELASAGYPINLSYVPLISQKEIQTKENESLIEYYERCHLVASTALNRIKSGTVLLVGHSSTLDTCIRKLATGSIARSPGDFHSLLKGIPYCGVAYLKEEAPDTSTQDQLLDIPSTSCWSISKPPIMTLQHTANAKYEWKLLKT